MKVDILPDCSALSLVVRNATWSAAYELHATTEAGVPAPSVSLHYRARITQSTGEDWTDVKLTLSTADMDLSNKTIPVFIPTKIRPPKSLFGYCAPGYVQTQNPSQSVAFGQTNVPPPTTFGQASALPPSAFGQPRAPVFGQPSISPAPAFGQASAVPVASFGAPAQSRGLVSAPPGLFGAPAQPALAPSQSADIPADDSLWDFGDDIGVSTTAIGEQPTSVVHESPLALTYYVEGSSGVPSDGVPHQVSIAVLPFEANIQHVTVPKVRPVAYLQATVKNTSDYRLLPGPVHAFVDDSFVSKTAILGADVAPGDVFSCTLGEDRAARIRYARTAKRSTDGTDGAARERSAFSEQWAATTYRSRTTVANRHPFALRELVVRDGVPVSEDEGRVCVVLRRPAGLAELEQGAELQVNADDDEEEDKGKKQRVRWGKVVDGKGGKKEGVLEWVVEVGAGEELTIETEWDVKAPVSLRWVESV